MLSVGSCRIGPSLVRGSLFPHTAHSTRLVTRMPDLSAKLVRWESTRLTSYSIFPSEIAQPECTSLLIVQAYADRLIISYVKLYVNGVAPS
jgi:hypothetical protein